MSSEFWLGMTILLCVLYVAIILGSKNADNIKKMHKPLNVHVYLGEISVTTTNSRIPNINEYYLYEDKVYKVSEVFHTFEKTIMVTTEEMGEVKDVSPFIAKKHFFNQVLANPEKMGFKKVKENGKN